MNYSRIRAARKNAGITQEQLAKMIGINRATLSRYESGDIDPPSSQLGRIADVLNVPIGELYDFSIEAEQNRTVDEIKEIKTQLKSLKMHLAYWRSLMTIFALHQCYSLICHLWNH